MRTQEGFRDPEFNDPVQARMGMSYSDADIGQIALAKGMVQEEAERVLSLMQAQAVERHRNRLAYDDVTFISLGYDCLSRTGLTR
jgi:hypothetical protein